MTRAEHETQKARVLARESMQDSQTALHGSYARRVLPVRAVAPPVHVFVFPVVVERPAHVL